MSGRFPGGWTRAGTDGRSWVAGVSGLRWLREAGLWDGWRCGSRSVLGHELHYAGDLFDRYTLGQQGAQ